jgi:hypothetical protein
MLNNVQEISSLLKGSLLENRQIKTLTIPQSSQGGRTAMHYSAYKGLDAVLAALLERTPNRLRGTGRIMAQQPKSHLGKL